MDRKQTATIAFLGLFCSVLLLLVGCDEMRLDMFDKKEPEPEIGPIDSSVVTANTQFGFNLFDEIRKTEQDKNIFISPLSVSLALAMTRNGAAGETEQAMTNTLQLQGLDAEAINVGYAGLHQTLLTADPKVTLAIANSLWARQGVPFNQSFLQRNTQFFGAEISTLDFDDPNASKTINKWVDTNTKGKIQKIVDDQIDPLTVLFLINAIYFKGTWQEEFDPSETREGPFHLANGDVKAVPMMRQERQYPYYRGERFQAIRLAYGDGQMSMYIFLPDRESDLNNFLENLNAEGWENWMSQFHGQDVSLVMPKFKLEYKKTLNDALQALGMGIAFGQGANFSRMSLSGRDFFIKEVLHKTFVEVNEEGTEAAAVTKVEVGITSVPPPPIPFTIDRPFFFAIRDNQTKTVLFMGAVVDPAP
ncbi:proteinase inhibitor I4 serpin [Candidatus Poribacteria bacterium]|nr:MAG: proteinase inhibitor I4 serpin [Candidatus Poribacteria bacterium]